MKGRDINKYKENMDAQQNNIDPKLTRGSSLEIDRLR